MSDPSMIPDTPPALALLPATAKSAEEETPLDRKRPDRKKTASAAPAEIMNKYNTLQTYILYLTDYLIIIHTVTPVV